jgi:hypothetical protein
LILPRHPVSAPTNARPRRFAAFVCAAAFGFFTKQHRSSIGQLTLPGYLSPWLPLSCYRYLALQAGRAKLMVRYLLLVWLWALPVTTLLHFSFHGDIAPCRRKLDHGLEGGRVVGAEVDDSS